MQTYSKIRVELLGVEVELPLSCYKREACREAGGVWGQMD